MLRAAPQIIRRIAVRMLVVLSIVIVLSAAVVVACDRRIILVSWRTCGGRQYWDYVSCGSSAGNFGYTCAEDGSCYENPNLTDQANGNLWML